MQAIVKNAVPKLPVCIAGLYLDNEIADKRSEWGISHKEEGLRELAQVCTRAFWLDV